MCFWQSAVMLGQAETTKTEPPAPNMGRTPPDLSLPIDSGLLILLIAGLIYGIYITTKRVNAKSRSQ